MGLSKYTLELRFIDPLFDFDYNFYDNEFKCEFEKKFKDRFYFHEIGFETVGRFKHALKSRLNMKMPYYSQLYESEMKAKKIDFLLNKDLKETFLREVNNEGERTESNNSTSTASSQNSNLTKMSMIGDGVSKATLDDKSLTGVSGDNATGTSTGSNTGSSQGTNRDKQLEKTELISQGNIGVTSSAELLEKWRSVMINLDEMIIEDCRSLFMCIM